MRSEAELRQAIATLEQMLPVMTPDNHRCMVAALGALRWVQGEPSSFGALLSAAGIVRRQAQERN